MEDPVSGRKPGAGHLISLKTIKAIDQKRSIISGISEYDPANVPWNMQDLAELNDVFNYPLLPYLQALFGIGTAKYYSPDFRSGTL